MRKLALFAAVALAGASCLSVGTSPIGPLDETPPTVVRMSPNLPVPLVLPDGGSDVYTIPVAGSVEITFSEEMDHSSLRAGISVRSKAVEVPINVVAPESRPNPSDADREETITLAAGSTGWPVGINRLVLKTLLVDRQGNAIVFEGEQPEAIYFFNVR